MNTKDYFDQQIQEMRLRRDTEEKLVRLWLAICAGILTAAFAFVQWAEDLYLAPIFLVFAAVLLDGVGKRIADKIEAEHKVYESIGQGIVALLTTDFSLGDPSSTKPNIGSDIKELGKGEGYKETAKLVRFSTRVVAIALVALAVVYLVVPASPRTRQPNKVTGANSRPASKFESRGLRRHALAIESHGRYHGVADVAQFWRQRGSRGQ